MKLFSRQDQQQPQQHRSVAFVSLKWSLIAMSLICILSTIWTGIYMDKAIEHHKNNWPNDRDLRHYSNDDVQRESQVWRGVIIASLVIMSLVNIAGAGAAFKESDLLVTVYGVVLMAYSVFAAGSYYTKGAISSWLIAFITALVAFVYAHYIRVEVVQPPVYTRPSQGP